MTLAATRSTAMLMTACSLLTACASSHQPAPSTMLPPRPAPLPERADPVIAAWSAGGFTKDIPSYTEAMARHFTGLATPRTLDGPPSPRFRHNRDYEVFVWADGTIAYSDTRDFSWDPLRIARVDPSEVESAIADMHTAGLFSFPVINRFSSSVPDASWSGIAAFTPTQTGAAFMTGFDSSYASSDEANKHREAGHRAMLALDELISKATPLEVTMTREELPALHALLDRLQRSSAMNTSD